MESVIFFSSTSFSNEYVIEQFPKIYLKKSFLWALTKSICVYISVCIYEKYKKDHKIIISLTHIFQVSKLIIQNIIRNFSRLWSNGYFIYIFYVLSSNWRIYDLYLYIFQNHNWISGNHCYFRLSSAPHTCIMVCLNFIVWIFSLLGGNDIQL